MPIPDNQALMMPVLRAFNSGCYDVESVAVWIAEEFDISEEDAAKLIPSGKATLLESRIHKVRQYLSRLGLLHSPRRNMFVVTPAGKTLLATKPQFVAGFLNGLSAIPNGWKASRAV